MSHTCHAIGCEKRVPPTMFMCKSHWFKVPKFLRDGIWATYRPGQCDDWNITPEYAEVAKQSIVAVAEKEGRTVDPQCDELQMYDVLVDIDKHPIVKAIRDWNMKQKEQRPGPPQ